MNWYNDRLSIRITNYKWNHSIYNIYTIPFIVEIDEIQSYNNN